ncbi:P-loop containing nucleoside triphosphate hydrolase protein [Tothia fuscella]|uniref:P-loop containing nucleoside triphosphate hydrolase protein n=1 Tax=Tothia fuscella TaxID=1048955 RepID=A0A9P4NMU1_9PEZI|nr:P-loop containing nucleoside triphosphate hydrolase protein [Tothia fuscella]
MSYYEETDSSILLNRFSQDMSLIDMQLPMAAFQVVSGTFQCIMNAILICLGSSYVAAIIPGVLFMLYWIQRFYLRTSRQIRLLDLETKSPLYKQFTETLEGVETIRALGWQETFEHVAREKLDMSQRPYYLMWCIQRWLNLVLDMLVACLAVLLIALALCLPGSSSAGSLGVALTSLLAFNQSLKALITAWTQAETSIGSVARTKSFEDETPTEISPDEDVDPGADWPLGELEVRNMSLSYKDGTKALKNVSFTVKAGQKFGVCGRTGSGKSTLLSSLLRLIDPSEGAILIDGVDIAKVPRAVVRDRLICLPQDALVFPGTFKFNLDPIDRIKDDSAITAVLKRVHLLDLVEKRGGITSELKADTLSHGEQQLLALARAILRKQAASGKCILVLDEATSNLDLATEALIQEVIKNEFQQTTVIMVAHRLETVREVDAILMLEKGEISKIGTPAEVL